ncbi:hypothetical protein EYZ11_008560 [Aspergillus tanneri]|uniref:Uncharacterized protein n=1 Tax=Aspergillus tanneri TaxID=1220188 RepID=A0A4S3JA55_9EURO|nr:hypothetical protein EYZ11_008560 [Aspergillus tanneri]
MVMADTDIEATTIAWPVHFPSIHVVGAFCITRAPEFFHQNNIQFAMNTEPSYFDWLGHNPELASDFQLWMTLKQRATPNWVDWFDIQGRILEVFQSESADNDHVLLVEHWRWRRPLSAHIGWPIHAFSKIVGSTGHATCNLEHS